MAGGALSFEGQIVLVTGAGRGLGAAVAEAFAAAGAAVAVTDIDGDAAAATAAALSKRGAQASAHALDIADLEACEKLARELREEVGLVSVLVNNAGTSGHAALDDPAARVVWDRQLAVNLTGTFNVTRAFATALRERGGAIVNFASITAFNAVTSAYGYMASKAGVKLLTQTLAKELASDGVRVNAVAPGVINTEMTRARRADPAFMADFHARTPLARTGEPAEVAAAVLFLASPMASYITGVTLPVDGGFLAV